MTSAPATTRVEKRKVEFREKIADAAYELFIRDGVSNTSVASIVKHADIAHQTFFNHFPTKNHLLLHLADRIGDLAIAIFTETDSLDITPPEKIEYCYSKLIQETIKLDPNMKELICIVLIGTPEGTNEIKAEQDMRLNQAIYSILKEAEEQNLLTPGFSLNSLAETVKGMFVYTFINWARQDDYPIVDRMDEVIRFIKHSVFVDRQ